MTLNQFHSLVPGKRVRLAGSRDTGTVIRISKYTPSALVRCRDCANASEFIENSCYCKAMGRRVCAANRYGKPCKYFVKVER